MSTAYARILVTRRTPLPGFSHDDYHWDGPLDAVVRLDPYLLQQKSIWPVTTGQLLRGFPWPLVVTRTLGNLDPLDQSVEAIRVDYVPGYWRAYWLILLDHARRQRSLLKFRLIATACLWGLGHWRGTVEVGWDFTYLGEFLLHLRVAWHEGGWRWVLRYTQRRLARHRFG